tara:strand:- start:301 stop:1014 length:714 start_codon:yes stop_codon:yes gene_type:complete
MFKINQPIGAFHPMSESYTLTLAFIDYFIVILSGIGLLFAARTIYQRSNSAGQTAFFGSLMIVTGGICGTTSKLLISFNNSDYLLLGELLWPLQGTGLTLVFAAALQWSLHASHKAPKILPILMATIVLATSLWMKDSSPEDQASFFLLLGASIIFFSGVILVFIAYGIKQKLYLAASLLVISLCTNVAIQPSASAFDLIINTPLLPYAINAVTQLFFASGMWLIYNAVLNTKKMPR